MTTITARVWQVQLSLIVPGHAPVWLGMLAGDGRPLYDVSPERSTELGAVERCRFGGTP